MRRRVVGIGIALVVAVTLMVSYLRTASAHCDTMDGPVIQAAQEALESGNVNEVLPWVSAENEAEIKAAFERARNVRTLGGEAQELADQYFFETLVRVHRAGEGEPYTGIKPAGTEISPAVTAADEALEAENADELIEILTTAVREGVEARYAEAKEKREADPDDVAARREGVHTYVTFTHYVEGVYAAATSGGANHAHAATVSHTPEAKHEH